jgi:arylsulfatase A-like enzyme
MAKVLPLPLVFVLSTAMAMQGQSTPQSTPRSGNGAVSDPGKVHPAGEHPDLSDAGTGGKPGQKPNVVLIFPDDLGMGDVGVYGSEDIPTPHIDALAAGGVVFEAGYVSAPQCAPSRAGIMTGRYQNRFGFEYNYNNAIVEDAPTAGLDPAEATFADRMREAGYATGIIGKWHLGQEDVGAFHPLSRGFDFFYGFLRGATQYLPPPGTGSIPHLFRNHEPVQESEYLTDRLAREVISFIDRHRDTPFFLYVPFNAPHSPLEATEKYLDRVSGIEDPTRRTYAAMVSALDDAVGAITQALEERGLLENTLVFFVSDNGGQPRYGGSNNPFKGEKGQLWEGGIRVPFIAHWPARYPAGLRFKDPVIALDILPTATAAAGYAAQPGWNLDGVDLTPYVTGAAQGAPHESLFWRLAVRPEGPDDIPWAIRQGDWKLVGVRKQDHRGRHPPRFLGNLREDPYEQRNLDTQHPERVEEMERAYNEWAAQMADPAWRLQPLP